MTSECSRAATAVTFRRWSVFIFPRSIAWTARRKEDGVAKRQSKQSTPAWSDERLPGKVFVAYAERPFDFVWGIELWGAEIHGERGPQPFTRTDANGEPVKLKDATGEPVPDPDGPRDPATGKFLHFRHVKDLHDVVVLTGTGPGRGTRHIEANSTDWKLPAGLILTPPFSEAGQSMLRELGLARRHSDTFEPLPDLIRVALLTTCGVAPELLPSRTGPQIEEILRQHAAALGLVREQPVTSEPELPLPKAAALIYEKLLTLKPHEAMLTSEIQDWYEDQTGKNLDEGTWKNLRKEMEPYGLKNRPRVGYYIDQKMTL